VTGTGPSRADGTPRFLARIAANAIRIARRETQLGQEFGERHRRGRVGFGFASDT